MLGVNSEGRTIVVLFLWPQHGSDAIPTQICDTSKVEHENFESELAANEKILSELATNEKITKGISCFIAVTVPTTVYTASTVTPGQHLFPHSPRASWRDTSLTVFTIQYDRQGSAVRTFLISFSGKLSTIPLRPRKLKIWRIDSESWGLHNLCDILKGDDLESHNFKNTTR